MPSFREDKPMRMVTDRRAVATAIGRRSKCLLLGAGAVAALLIAAPDGSMARTDETRKPSWLSVMSHKTYDGALDDLVTGGLGVSAMLAGERPTYADPRHPTAAELRRAVLFTSPLPGFGTLWGPNIDPVSGEVLPGDGKIAGEEYLAFADDGSGRQNVAMLLQVPAAFRVEAPCILAVPPGGSASLYRDVTTIGYWGLLKRCAVVYTDKGLGNGVHDLATDTVNLIDGTRATADAAGKAAHFAADLSDHERASFLARYPHRVAFKHAHSRQNPDASWGRDVVRSVQFAFYQLNRDLAGRRAPLTRENTLVIAAGNSNGGGAVLYAGEQDRQGWIDAIVAAQPQVQLRPNDEVLVRRDDRARRGTGRTLLDYFTHAILYQPCAAVATPGAPLRSSLTFAENRCASLKAKGLLSTGTLADQAREALGKLRAYGWEPESDLLHASHYAVAPTATAAKYASAQGRFGVEDRVCGYSLAAVDADGVPVATPPEVLATIFATAPGGAPAGPIDIVNDRDPRGSRRDFVSLSPSTGAQDFNLDGASCLRELVTGRSKEARRVRQGIRELLGSADLRGKPTIIVHGRADTRVPIGFSSRPYVGLNSLVEGGESRLRFYELTHVEHLNLPVPGYDNRFLPIQPYQIEALELIHAHLTRKEPLPPSQVVRTVPRGGAPGAAPPLTRANLTPIGQRPERGDLIEVRAGRVTVPD
jgi:hydroxybutyrate-dimer hydrolase